MASNLPPRPLVTNPTRAHTASAFLVKMEPLPSGGYRISTPHARGWAATATTPVQLALAFAHAEREVLIASYARAKGKVYDLDQMTERVPDDSLAGNPGGKEKRRPRRGRSHSPVDWQMTDTGKWRSPGSGRVYSPESPVGRRVVAKRQALGLPTT